MNLERLKKLLARERALPEEEQDAELIADLEAQIEAIENPPEEIPEETPEETPAAPVVPDYSAQLEALSAKLETALNPKPAEPPKSKANPELEAIQKELLLMKAHVPLEIQALIPEAYSVSQLKEYLASPAYTTLKAKLETPAPIRKPVETAPKGKPPEGVPKAKAKKPVTWGEITTADLAEFDNLFAGEF